MMPKLITLAWRRISSVTRSGITPKTSAAVRVWMSSPASKGLDQVRVLREVGQDPQLDLGVVGGEQHAALPRR